MESQGVGACLSNHLSLIALCDKAGHFIPVHGCGALSITAKSSPNAVFFLYISWKGKHPFQLSRANFELTLYRFLEQYPTHERPRYYSKSPVTSIPHGALPTRWSDHLSMQTPVRIPSQNLLPHKLHLQRLLKAFPPCVMLHACSHLLRGSRHP